MTTRELLAVLRSGLPPTAREIAQALESRMDAILTETGHADLADLIDPRSLALMQALGEILAPMFGGR